MNIKFQEIINVNGEYITLALSEYLRWNNRQEKDVLIMDLRWKE